MTAGTLVHSISLGRLWTGRIISAIFITFFLADGIAHLIKPVGVTNAFNQLALPIRLSVPLGILQLALIGVYLVPATSVWGAVLLTGYLGGAMAIHLRCGDGAFPLLFPLILGFGFWIGLLLRSQPLYLSVFQRS